MIHSNSYLLFCSVNIVRVCDANLMNVRICVCLYVCMPSHKHVHIQKQEWQ